MLIRSAFWIGRPLDGLEERFRMKIMEGLAPAVRSCPGVDNVKVLWPDEREDGAPAIHCQFLVIFLDAEGKAAMISSPERAAFGPIVQEAKKMFDGILTHINFNVS